MGCQSLCLNFEISGVPEKAPFLPVNTSTCRVPEGDTEPLSSCGMGPTGPMAGYIPPPPARRALEPLRGEGTRPSGLAETSSGLVSAARPGGGSVHQCGSKCDGEEAPTPLTGTARAEGRRCYYEWVPHHHQKRGR